MAEPRFTRFAAIDWSGAQGHRHKGIAIAICETGDAAPTLVGPPDAAAWSRDDVLGWLLDQDRPTLIGLDLSPAFPFVDHDSYFPGASDGPSDARALWAMIDKISAADPHLAVSSLLGDPELRRHFRQHRDCGDLFPGGAGRMRVCEHGQRAMGLSPTSCFNLVGAAQVGKSSLTGMRVLHRIAGRVPIWPPAPPASAKVLARCATPPRSTRHSQTSAASRTGRSPATTTTRLTRSSPLPGSAPTRIAPNSGRQQR
jgi:hypothetical protein